MAEYKAVTPKDVAGWMRSGVELSESSKMFQPELLNPEDLTAAVVNMIVAGVLDVPNEVKALLSDHLADIGVVCALTAFVVAGFIKETDPKWIEVLSEESNRSETK